MKGSCGPTKFDCNVSSSHTFLTFLKAAGPAMNCLTILLCIANVDRCFLLWPIFHYSISELSFIQGTVILRVFINLDLEEGGSCVSKQEVRDGLWPCWSSAPEQETDTSLLNLANAESASHRSKDQRATLKRQSIFNVSVTKWHMHFVIWEPPSYKVHHFWKRKNIAKPWGNVFF